MVQYWIYPKRLEIFDLNFLLLFHAGWTAVG
jgi:hypothetical protein